MIEYFGHSMFLIDRKIVIDPHDGGSIGLPKPSIDKVDLVLITHDHYDHNAYEILSYNDMKMKYYGYISYQNYKITGYKAYHDKEKGRRRGETAIYKIEDSEGNVIVHLGDLGEYPLKEDLIKEISSPTVLMIPVGGLITIDYKEAASLVKDLKPQVVIPMHYWVRGHLMPLDPVDNFIKELGWKVVEGKKGIEKIEDKEAIYLLTV
ncbi:MBL fold metallo-hydrolase [Acidianus infernus]|uniref:MBL fold metallo-hydrolase n=1 Tax=Acidianus infernus TaxID=12915 RepID=UPI0035947013